MVSLPVIPSCHGGGLKQPVSGSAILSTDEIPAQHRQSVYAQIINVTEMDLRHIQEKRKSVHACIATPPMQRVFPGDIFRYVYRGNTLDTKVLTMVKYMSFKEMLEYEGLTNCLPECPNIDAGVSTYHSIHSNEAQAAKLGVIAIRITTDLSNATPVPRPILIVRGGKTTHVLTRQEHEFLTRQGNIGPRQCSLNMNRTLGKSLEPRMNINTCSHSATKQTKTASTRDRSRTPERIVRRVSYSGEQCLMVLP